MEGELKTDGVFLLMKNYLASGEGKHLVAKVGGIFQMDILNKKGGKIVKQFHIDLKNGQGSAAEGPNKSYNALFSVSDADFYNICQGKLNPQMAFIQGKMKIKGAMGMASKFTPDLFPKPTPENIQKYAKAKL